MKIELGKTYKTRSGRKARVVCVDLKGEGVCSVVALVAVDGGESVEEYTPDGYYYDDGEISDADLVSEWREPLTVWATTSDSGTVHILASEHSARACAAATGQRWRVVKLVEVPE